MTKKFKLSHEMKSQNYDMQINDLVSQHELSHNLKFVSHNYDLVCIMMFYVTKSPSNLSYVSL